MFGGHITSRWMQRLTGFHRFRDHTPGAEAWNTCYCTDDARRFGRHPIGWIWRVPAALLRRATTVCEMAGDGQSDVHGVGLRNWLLDLLRRRPLYLPDDLSVNAAYFRRIYGNFAVTDNTAVAPADYDPFCVTAPADPRLPGGGRQICGLFDLNPAKVGQVSTLGTDASHYGNVYDQWNGVDLSMNARLQKVLLQGGVSTGKTMT